MQHKYLYPTLFSWKASLLLVCFLVVTLSLGCVSHHTMGPILSAGKPGVSALNQTTLISALPFKNTGEYEAKSVLLEAISLKDAALTTPLKLPFHLGTISAGSSAILDAGFVGKEQFTPGSSFVVTVKGTYVDGTITKNFVVNYDLVIPPRAPGSSELTEAKVEPNKSAGPYPPYKPQRPGFVSANPAGPPVPTAPFVSYPEITSSTELLKASLDGPKGEGGKSLNQMARPIVFNGINKLGLTGVNTIAEPSGASNGDGLIFATVNSVAAFSMDGGNTFTQVNPTTVFPADTVGFCCDQIVQYVPSIDRFIWLLQGSTTATQAGGYRLASARPADIISNVATAWTYWNLTPAVFGQPAGTGFDYPDMAVGNNFLYLSWDAGLGCPAGCSSGFQVSRIPLAGIQAGGTIGIGFTDPTDATMAWGSHISQNTFDEVFWAGHNSNSNMRVFSLAEGSNSYFWRDVGLSSWANNAPTSTTPDGQDWLGKNFSGATGGGAFPRNAVIGSTRSGNQIWFAWTAGTDRTFQQAHVEMVALDRLKNFSVIQQVQIWNNNYAFAYPALATLPCNGEVGLSLEYGGNGNYENHVVGFWGDFVVYITTGSDVGTNRFGDYVTIRQEPETRSNSGNLFNAYGYGLNSLPGAGTQVDVRHVLYGRPKSECIIIE